jgi:hypothetical protein
MTFLTRFPVWVLCISVFIHSKNAACRCSSLAREHHSLFQPKDKRVVGRSKGTLFKVSLTCVNKSTSWRSEGCSPCEEGGSPNGSFNFSLLPPWQSVVGLMWCCMAENSINRFSKVLLSLHENAGEKWLFCEGIVDQGRLFWKQNKHFFLTLVVALAS